VFVGDGVRKVLRYRGQKVSMSVVEKLELREGPRRAVMSSSTS